MNGLVLFLMLFAMVIILVLFYVYWANKYESLICERGRKLSVSECKQKAKEISDFLEAIETNKNMTDVGFSHKEEPFGQSLEEFVYRTHDLGCEIVIRQVSKEDIEDERITPEIIRRHIQELRKEGK